MTTARDPSIMRAGFILGAVTFFEGIFVLPPLFFHPIATLVRLGLAPGRHESPLLAWILAALVTVLFVWHARRFPSVRQNLLRISWLKVLALGLAVVAGILEEYYFRGILMDAARNAGIGAVTQVVFSALAFGAAHAIWALFEGSVRGGIGAMVATGILGFLLAIVYLASHRNLGPCVAAHFALDLFLEPGLVLAAIRGEMGRP